MQTSRPHSIAGNIAGSVRDTHGATVPAATVTLTSATRGTSQDTVTNQTGDFVFPNVAGDTYIIRVTLEGFKTLDRPNVAVSPGDRIAVGTLVLEVGTLSETVTVSTEAPLLQASSGERSFTVTTEAVQNLPINSRNWSALTALTPGVLGTTRVGNAGQQNNTVMMDGVAIMDTGNNGQMLQTNIDAIAEVKILTSGYQAEYGRSSGMQITAVTKSGTNQLRGSIYDLERNSDWNANSWVNAKNGDPKAISKQRDWGYTIGGPVGRPGSVNKLFFFYAHEYRPRTQRRQHHTLPRTDTARTPGGLLADDRQQRQPLQPDPGRVHRTAVHGQQHDRLFPGGRRGGAHSTGSALPDRPEHPEAVAGAQCAGAEQPDAVIGDR